MNIFMRNPQKCNNSSLLSKMKASESSMGSLVNTIQTVFQATQCGNSAIVRLLGTATL